MQTLVLISSKNDNVVIQKDGVVYSDTYQNFVLKDGGAELPLGVESFDYNKSVEHCWINGKAFQDYPNKYCEALIRDLKKYYDSKASRDKIEEDIKTEKIFEQYDIDAKKAEEDRVANLTDEEREQEMISNYCAYAQELLDSKAKELLYDDMNSLCSYVGSSNPKFAGEARKASDWRDSVWAKCYQLLDMVKDGQIEIPSKEVFISMLPAFSWDE